MSLHRFYNFALVTMATRRNAIKPNNDTPTLFVNKLSAKLKQNWNKTETKQFRPTQPWNVLAVLANHKSVSAVYAKLQSIMLSIKLQSTNRRSYALLVSVNVTTYWRSYLPPACCVAHTAYTDGDWLKQLKCFTAGRLVLAKTNWKSVLFQFSCNCADTITYSGPQQRPIVNQGRHHRPNLHHLTYI